MIVVVGDGDVGEFVVARGAMMDDRMNAAWKDGHYVVDFGAAASSIPQCQALIIEMQFRT
jgi:hypothetical protein